MGHPSFVAATSTLWLPLHTQFLHLPGPALQPRLWTRKAGLDKHWTCINSAQSLARSAFSVPMFSDCASC